MTFESAYAKLTPEQKKAVDAIEGPMMVLAGPGTGKTQILSLRIARILQLTQLEPHNILCLTFTESGVSAMRRRLFEFIGTPAYYVRIHTFHSFCNEIIKDHPEKFLFARELEPLSDVERVLMFRKLLDELTEGTPLKPFASPYMYQKELVRVIQELKREDLSPEKLADVLQRIEKDLTEHEADIDAFITIHGGSLKTEDILSAQKNLASTFLAPHFEGFDLEEKKERTELKNKVKDVAQEARDQLPKQKALVTAYKNYQNQLKKAGRYDYEDMILMVVEKLKKDPELLAKLQEQFQYILVDEYQDTNGAQNEVVELLASYYENPNVFVVGDDKQSIYRFQGASLENMIAFYQRYKSSVQLVSLQHNYRSQQAILDSATELIRHNEQGLETLIPELEQNLLSQVNHSIEAPKRVELSSPSEERHFILNHVKDLLEQGTSPSEIAILFRNNRDADELVELFLRSQIPFRVFSGKNILEDKNIQKLLALLRWLNDPSDERTLFFILHSDFLQIPSLEALKLTRMASSQRIKLWDALENGSERIGWLRTKLAEWQGIAVNKTMVEFFEVLINESGYLNFILAQPDKIEHLNRLNTFFDQIKQWNKAKSTLTLSELMDNINLLIENDLSILENELSTEKNAVVLMTAHKSKGLEFEHVLMMRCVDKHWGNNPSRNKLKLPAGLLKTLDLLHKERNEDERRLFYVAMTRAKKTLTLSYALTNANGKPETPALFLEEISTETLTQTATGESEEVRLLNEFAPIVKTISADEQDYVRGLLKDYQLSVTHLNNYLDCPLRFYYDNLLRVPKAKNRHQSFGTAVHEALKDFHLDFRSTGVPKKDLLLERYKLHLKREVLTEKDWKACEEFGLETLNNYFDQYKDSFHKNVLVEESFKSHNVRVDGVPITGQLDKIEILDESAKTVNVVDFKTGTPDNKGTELGHNGKYRRQIIFYQLLCDLSTQFPYTMVSGEIDFLQKSAKSNTYIKKHFVVTEEEKQNLITEIKETYEDIQNLRFLNPDEFSLCGECDYCKILSR